VLTLAIPIWDIMFRAAVIYVAVLVGLRLAGKREMGQMTVSEFCSSSTVWHSSTHCRRSASTPDQSPGAGRLFVERSVVGGLRHRRDPAGRGRVERAETLAVYRAGHRRAAGHRRYLVLPDDSRLPVGGWGIHRGLRQPGHLVRVDGCHGAPHRLRAHGGGQYHGRGSPGNSIRIRGWRQ
jgi:hypothetical protein